MLSRQDLEGFTKEKVKRNKNQNGEKKEKKGRPIWEKKLRDSMRGNRLNENSPPPAEKGDCASESAILARGARRGPTG